MLRCSLGRGAALLRQRDSKAAVGVASGLVVVGGCTWVGSRIALPSCSGSAAKGVQAVFSRAMTTGPSNGGAQGSKSLLQRYMQLLDEKPIAAKVLTSVVIGGAGDVACQLLVDNDRPFSFRRLFNMAFLGAVLVAPCLHVWYGFLAKTIPGSSWLAVGKRLAADQLVFAPSFVALFFCAMATVQGAPEESVKRLQDGWLDAVVMNYKIWPLAQVINFRFIPVQHQVLFANFVALFWNTYLSFATNKKK